MDFEIREALPSDAEQVLLNAKKCGGSLATPLEIYMDEWAQLRRNTKIC